MKYFKIIFFSFLILLLVSTVKAQTKNQKNWLTHFEKSNFLETAKYDETMAYFKKLADASPYANMFSFGVSPQGRKLYCVVISKDKAFDPVEAKETGKPIILIENGIHSGEIEGKDASMLLLREILITKEKENLIDSTILLVIPIFSVDAHERFGSYHRINQNGPTEMGWRTTAQNLNLNRDWTKADAPEMKAMLNLFSSWLPDFFIDTHTTDGADYQYTITYAIEKYKNIFTGTRNWINNKLIPYFEKKVNDDGFLITQYFGFKGYKIEDGLTGGSFGPRFSHSYAAAQNRPGLLIETHMMKPYKDRVYSTKSLLNAVIEFVNNDLNEIMKLNKQADADAINRYSINKEYLPLSLKLTDSHKPFVFKGFKAIRDSSWLSGGIWTRFTNEKIDINTNYYDEMEISDSVSVPSQYIIPEEWGNWEGLIDRIKLHGIKVDKLAEPQKFIVTKYKFKNRKFANYPYEGHQRVNSDYDSYKETVIMPKGTFVINTDQRTVKVLVNLLEPKAEDSFLQWGFFNSIFERKEYFESYVMEKVAREMISKNPELKIEFEKKLAEDKKFRESQRQRLNFFYERSPYVDDHLNIYPVMCVE